MGHFEKMAKTRNYFFTWNNYSESDRDAVLSLDVKYMIVGREVGDSGTPHLQGTIVFKNQRSFRSIKNLFKNWHAEPCKNLLDCIKYCKKDGDFEEVGVPPEKNGGYKIADKIKRNRLLRDKPLNDLVNDGDICITQVRKLKNARMDLSQENDATGTDATRGVWIYGPPGTGKSHMARELYGDSLYIKPQNKWFDGYAGEKHILLDDLDIPALGHYLKIWSDKWPCSGEIKGGKVNLCHAVFIVTSNYLPSDLWPEDKNMRLAIERRFEMKHCLIKYNN